MAKLSIIDLNPLCVCGHDFLSHSRSYLGNECRVGAGDWKHFLDSCLNFKLDNLKYLEMLSKEKEVADL